MYAYPLLYTFLSYHPYLYILTAAHTVMHTLALHHSNVQVLPPANTLLIITRYYPTNALLLTAPPVTVCSMIGPLLQWSRLCEATSTLLCNTVQVDVGRTWDNSHRPTSAVVTSSIVVPATTIAIPHDVLSVMWVTCMGSDTHQQCRCTHRCSATVYSSARTYVYILRV